MQQQQETFPVHKIYSTIVVRGLGFGPASLHNCPRFLLYKGNMGCCRSNNFYNGSASASSIILTLMQYSLAQVLGLGQAQTPGESDPLHTSAKAQNISKSISTEKVTSCQERFAWDGPGTSFVRTARVTGSRQHWRFESIVLASSLSSKSSWNQTGAVWSHHKLSEIWDV